MAEPFPGCKTETCCDNREDSTRKENDNAGGNCVNRALSSERASESHHRAAHLCGWRLCPSRQSFDLGAANAGGKPQRAECAIDGAAIRFAVRTDHELVLSVGVWGQSQRH